MTVHELAGFIGDKLNKPVLLTKEDLKNKKLTLVCKDKKPVDEAMYLVRQALLIQGIVIDEQPQVVYIRPVEEVMGSGRARWIERGPGHLERPAGDRAERIHPAQL